jgi:hypothetical protein
MRIVYCVQLELYTNSFGGTTLKRHYVWGYSETVEYHWSRAHSYALRHFSVEVYCVQ